MWDVLRALVSRQRGDEREVDEEVNCSGPDKQNVIVHCTIAASDSLYFLQA
jgi:hypothetical protein